MIKKIFKIIILIMIPISLMVLLGFAASNNKKIPCVELSVTVVNHNCHQFIDSEKLKNEIKSKLTSIEGHPVKNSTLREIKEIVNKNPYIKKASVYRTIDGNISVQVTQREPLIRIINSHNQGFYIDVDGKFMPLSRNYTARVILAGGNILAGYSKELDIREIMNLPEASSNERLMADIYTLASYLNADPFWNAFIDYIHVLPQGKFELTPKNGAHIVEFGNIDKMEEKFQKLETFYLNGLTLAGWDKYSRVNVKFKNQVVCSNK